MPTIKFHVQDQAGGAIPGATITLATSATTNTAGEIHAHIPAGTYDGTVSALGYTARTFDWQFRSDGTVVVALESGPPVPPVTGDAIDVGAAIITAGTPDIRDWPITTTLTEFAIDRNGWISVNFGARNGPDAWPFVDGVEGEIQYTLGVGCCIHDVWYLSTPILCISRGVDDNYVPTGDTLAPLQLPENWYYYAGSPLANYSPRADELVAWFVAAGALRRGDIHTVMARSNVIVAPFRVGSFL